MQLIQARDLRVPSKRVAMVSRKVFWGASNPFITGIFPARCEILHQSLCRRMAREESAKKRSGERRAGREGPAPARGRRERREDARAGARLRRGQPRGARPARPAAPGPPGEAAWPALHAPRPREPPCPRRAPPPRRAPRPDRRRGGREGGARGCARLGARGDASERRSRPREPGNKDPFVPRRPSPGEPGVPWVWCRRRGGDRSGRYPAARAPGPAPPGAPAEPGARAPGGGPSPGPRSLTRDSGAAGVSAPSHPRPRVRAFSPSPPGGHRSPQAMLSEENEMIK